ncbi:hypothetical protein PV08_09497 [Exophiala spinifera]|uniref:Uncharacterized protein n=1 Tax=Exophiala spinifera TaxID=91928 RepID=A0A0D1YBB4_9EURO|nr:uncharacterized protein PV08_09497 [Exophiala spinifera]KIW12221.1 hypothetical protein PV08_09497 [Exophiala spinifera]
MAGQHRSLELRSRRLRESNDGVLYNADDGHPFDIPSPDTILQTPERSPSPEETAHEPMPDTPSDTSVTETSKPQDKPEEPEMDPRNSSSKKPQPAPRSTTSSSREQQRPSQSPQRADRANDRTSEERSTASLAGVLANRGEALPLTMFSGLVDASPELDKKRESELTWVEEEPQSK